MDFLFCFFTTMDGALLQEMLLRNGVDFRKMTYSFVDGADNVIFNRPEPMCF